MPGTFSPPPRVSDPDMHHGTCVTHVPWCMPGLITTGFLWSRCRGSRSRHSWRNFTYLARGPWLRHHRLPRVTTSNKGMLPCQMLETVSLLSKLTEQSHCKHWVRCPEFLANPRNHCNAIVGLMSIMRIYAFDRNMSQAIPWVAIKYLTSTMISMLICLRVSNKTQNQIQRILMELSG